MPSERKVAQDLRALILNRTDALADHADGKHVVALTIIDVNDDGLQSAKNSGVGIDRQKGLWCAPRGELSLEVHKIGEASKSVIPNQSFIVIDLNDDAHVEAAVEKIRIAIKNELTLIKH